MKALKLVFHSFSAAYLTDELLAILFDALVLEGFAFADLLQSLRAIPTHGINDHGERLLVSLGQAKIP